MKTRLMPVHDPAALALAVEILESGGLVAFPGDNVYELGAAAFNERAASQISELTGRPGEKPMAVLLGEEGQLGRVAAKISAETLQLSNKFWPGPLTIVLPRGKAVPDAVSPLGTVGVRIPDFPATIEMLKLSGPLAISAACVAGMSASTTARGAQAQLDGKVALILDGGVTTGGTPSTVVDCTSKRPFILREGPISLGEILKALG